MASIVAVPASISESQCRAGDSDSARQPTIDSGLDEAWRQKGKRDRHMNVALAAGLPCGGSDGLRPGMRHRSMRRSHGRVSIRCWDSRIDAVCCAPRSPAQFRFPGALGIVFDFPWLCRRGRGTARSLWPGIGGCCQKRPPSLWPRQTSFPAEFLPANRERFERRQRPVRVSMPRLAERIVVGIGEYTGPRGPTEVTSTREIREHSRGTAFPGVRC
jgi:hypothetical protein